MGLKSFKSVEQDEFITLPNAMSAVRAVGGMALGAVIGAHGVDPTIAFYTAAGLGFTDAEGSLISVASRFQRIQRMFRIIASKSGRYVDPIADKLLAISMLIGTTVSGVVPHWQAGGILVTELATAGVATYKKQAGGDPETPKVGKIGLIVRCAAIGENMAIPAFAETSHLAHELLAGGGDVTSAAAIALGAASCLLLSRTPIEQEPEALIA